MGTTDRIIRLLAATLFVAFNMAGVIKWPVSILAWVLVAILAITALVGSCPVYKLFGINTCARKPNI